MKEIISFFDFGILFFVAFAEICSFVYAFCLLVDKAEGQPCLLGKAQPKTVAFFQATAALAIAIAAKGNFFSLFLLSIICGVFIVASLQDWQSYMVYRFLWWISMGAGLLELFCGETMSMWEGHRLIMEWFLFALLQFFFFSKFYGKADCHAFCSSSLLLLAQGKGVGGYLLHMLTSLLLLGIVQVKNNNVDRFGNLKQKQAFVPYITLSFFLWLFFGAL